MQQQHLATMLPVREAITQIEGDQPLGFQRAQLLSGSSFMDCSTVVIVPTRGMVSWRVVQAWRSLMAPMNQKLHWIFAAGDEVGHAYNATIQHVLAEPTLSTWKFVLTLEDDNLPQPDAHIRLLESIEACKLDAVGGLYWTKGDYNMPMAYGDPDVYARTGVLDFTPRDVRPYLAESSKQNVMAVNGLAMGCTLYRMDLFRRVPAPHFVTMSDWTPGAGASAMTQDLFFCARAKRMGARFGVDLRVRVGHLDVTTGLVY